MNDDRFKDAGQFEPGKAWSKISQADADREFEAKNPTKWWHGAYFTLWGGAALLAIIVAIVGLLIWAFRAPYA